MSVLKIAENSPKILFQAFFFSKNTDHRPNALLKIDHSRDWFQGILQNLQNGYFPGHLWAGDSETVALWICYS